MKNLQTAYECVWNLLPTDNKFLQLAFMWLGKAMGEKMYLGEPTGVDDKESIRQAISRVKIVKDGMSEKQHGYREVEYALMNLEQALFFAPIGYSVFDKTDEILEQALDEAEYPVIEESFKPNLETEEAPKESARSKDMNTKEALKMLRNLTDKKAIKDFIKGDKRQTVVTKSQVILKKL